MIQQMKHKGDQYVSDKYYWMWREEKKKRQEAEGETTIVKAVGQHSPEMKLLQGEVEALKNQLHTDRETMTKKNSKYENAIAFSRKRIKELENSLSIALENISDNQWKTK